jgi:hypothetical protein
MRHLMIGRRFGRCTLPLFFVAVGLVAPGCSGTGDDLPREAISGTVTLDGQPLSAGTIQFTPSGGGTTTGSAVSGGSPINAGKFSIDREVGLTPGKYRVTVNAAGAKGTSPAGQPPEPGRPNRAERPTELIPAKYNAESTLSADVTKGGPNAFKFDLQSK